MFSLTPLKIFNDETIGRAALPDGLIYENNQSFVPSIIHGRSIAVKINDFDWILIKGGGWNYGSPQVYISRKDSELIFGLCPLSAAKRELQISQEIEKISNNFPKALYYKKLSDLCIGDDYKDLLDAKYSDGNKVEPCLLYTKVKCPYRIADIPYLENLDEVINKCCSFYQINREEYINTILEVLTKNVATLQVNGFIDDTLEYSNVTMLGEIVDYELITYPGVILDNGDDEQRLIEERKEKCILYTAEIIFQLSSLLHNKTSFHTYYCKVVEVYKKIDPKTIDTNENINKIVEGKKVIL